MVVRRATGAARAAVNHAGGAAESVSTVEVMTRVNQTVLTTL